MLRSADCPLTFSFIFPTLCYARTMRIIYLFALNRYEVLENIRVVQLRLHKASLTAKLDRLSGSKPVLRAKGESKWAVRRT